MLEKEIERYLKRRIEALGGKAIKFISPANLGVPDRIVISPGGTIYFIELKNEVGKLRKIQEYQAKSLMELGCNYKFINSKYEVDKLIEEIERKRNL